MVLDKKVELAAKEAADCGRRMMRAGPQVLGGYDGTSS